MRKLLFLLLLIGFTLSAQKTVTYQEVISKQKKGNFDIYIASNGEKFKVGDTITLGTAFRNEDYDYIRQNALIEYYLLPNRASGSKVIIKKIKSKSKVLIATTTKPSGFVYGLFILNFDEALKKGEILSKKMNRKQAIAKLKESKDLLDLEMISKEEYEKIKKELIPIIKGERN